MDRKCNTKDTTMTIVSNEIKYQWFQGEIDDCPFLPHESKWCGSIKELLDESKFGKRLPTVRNCRYVTEIKGSCFCMKEDITIDLIHVWDLRTPEGLHRFIQHVCNDFKDRQYIIALIYEYLNSKFIDYISKSVLVHMNPEDQRLTEKLGPSVDKIELMGSGYSAIFYKYLFFHAGFRTLEDYFNALDRCTGKTMTITLKRRYKALIS